MFEIIGSNPDVRRLPSTPGQPYDMLNHPEPPNFGSDDITIPGSAIATSLNIAGAHYEVETFSKRDPCGQATAAS